MNIGALRSRRVLWPALAATLLVVAAIVVPTVRAQFSGTGPLTMGGALPADEAAVSHGWSVDVGDQFAWGYNLVKNTGKTPVELVSVRMFPESKSSPVVDARAYPITANGTIALALWPMSRNGTSGGFGRWQDFVFPELAGYTVGGGKEAWVMVIFEVREPGRKDWDRIRVTYKAGGKKYAVEAPNALSICTPSGTICPVGPNS